MKPRFVIIMLITMLVCTHSQAQQVVLDPSQIAASAVNAADQMDYMLDQLGELADLGQQLGTVRDHFDKWFGEDGLGGQAISVLQDLGTLDRLTSSFNSTIKATQSYAEHMAKMERYRLSDANMILSYLNSMKKQAELFIETANKILTTVGFTKKEKKEEIERLVQESEETLRKIQTVVTIETQATTMAQGLSDFVDFIDTDVTVDNYVVSRSVYGSATSAARGSLGVISIVLGLLGIASCAYGYLLFVTGGIAGDSTSEQVFLRVGGAFIGGMVVINLISSAFGLNL
jgi:hypothetical protein